MIDSAKLVSPLYWFNPGPGDLSEPYLAFFLIFFSFFVVMYLFLRFMGRQYIHGMHKAQKLVLYRVERLFLTLGILGILWTFLRYELVALFSARFWLILWLGGLIVWAYVIFHYIRYQVPQIIAHDRDREHKLRYSSSKSRR